MKLLWSRYALRDRNEIFDFIEADSPAAAALVDERIWHAVAALKQFPELGRPGRVTGLVNSLCSEPPTSLLTQYAMRREDSPRASRGADVAVWDARSSLDT